MKIESVYHHYELMKTLQEHQLRVTTVAYLICQNIDQEVDVESILTACLLHDMGNIIKFNLDLYPEFLEPEGVEYWQELQQKYRQTYGQDAHLATMAIAREIGASEKVLDLINSIGYHKALETFASNDLEKLICAYADMRVGPFGVISLIERFNDLKIRYSIRYTGLQNPNIENTYLEIETQLKNLCSIDVNQIETNVIADIISILQELELELSLPETD